MTALAVYAALAILALATAAAITVTMRRAAQQLNQLTPVREEDGGGEFEGRGIRVNPGREEW